MYDLALQQSYPILQKNVLVFPSKSFGHIHQLVIVAFAIDDFAKKCFSISSIYSNKVSAIISVIPIFLVLQILSGIYCCTFS